jgi:hypothetical protein
VSIATVLTHAVTVGLVIAVIGEADFIHGILGAGREGLDVHADFGVTVGVGGEAIH